jgi:hypothetical protein
MTSWFLSLQFHKSGKRGGGVKVRGFVVTHPLIQDPKRLVPQIPISLYGTNFPSLVDTGSTISVLSSKVLPKDMKLLP